MNTNFDPYAQDFRDPTPVFTEAQQQAIARAFDNSTSQQEAKPAKRGRPQVQYVREQKGHSLTKHLLLGWVVLWIPAIYYSFSPNHYWRA